MTAPLYNTNARTTLRGENRRAAMIFDVLEEATAATIALAKSDLPFWEKREEHRRIYVNMAVRIRSIDPMLFAAEWPDWNLQQGKPKTKPKKGIQKMPTRPFAREAIRPMTPDAKLDVALALLRILANKASKAGFSDEPLKERRAAVKALLAETLCDISRLDRGLLASPKNRKKRAVSREDFNCIC